MGWIYTPILEKQRHVDEDEDEIVNKRKQRRRSTREVWTRTQTVKTETIWTREEKGDDKYEGGDTDDDEEYTDEQRRRREMDRNEEDWDMLVQLALSAHLTCGSIGIAGAPDRHSISM